MATTIPEAVTTISAKALRLLLTSISYRAKARKEMRREPPMVPRRPPRPGRRSAPPGGGCRVDTVQVETLPPQQVRRVQTMPAIRRRQELTLSVWHGLRCAALSGMDP